MNNAAENSDLVSTKLETSLVLNEHGQIVRQNDPVCSPGPRMLICGFESSNVTRLRKDVDPGLAAQLTEVVTTEPPLGERNSELTHGDEYIALLESQAKIMRRTSGLMFLFPPQFHYRSQFRLICSGTLEGDRLTGELEEDGLPGELENMGFDGVTDFWEPWCAAMHENRIASLGFTARLGRFGAESGVVTVPGLRGRGFAAASVSGWAQHPDLKGKRLFYSVDRSNTSSQKVVERLDLIFIGTSFAIF